MTTATSARSRRNGISDSCRCRTIECVRGRLDRARAPRPEGPPALVHVAVDWSDHRCLAPGRVTYGRSPNGTKMDAMTADQPPTSFEVDESGKLLHGTKADLEVGDVLTPGHASNFEDGRQSNHVYVTGTLDAAAWGAELARGDGPGRIYIVEVDGELEDDPNLTDKKFPGNPTRSYRTRYAGADRRRAERMDRAHPRPATRDTRRPCDSDSRRSQRDPRLENELGQQ